MNTAAKANSSLNNHTGSWRSRKPQVLPEKCLSCGLCAKICPDACIGMEQGKAAGNKKIIAAIDYRYCKGCGLCARECPARAITMEKQEL